MITDSEKIAFARKYTKYATEQECIEAYDIYRSYRDEGQSDVVSRQYAGLTSDLDYDKES